MALSHSLDTLHARARRTRALQHFTAFTRILLAVGFFSPGMVKVLGLPFTALGPEHPVGYFFSAFQGAELWYRSVGVGQVTAALLLLFPRTATLGAVLYFPIIVNIMLVTISIDFAGTKFITILMTLAVLYLLCWDFDRLKGILPRRPARRAGRARRGVRVAVGYLVGFAAAGVTGFLALAALHIGNVQDLGSRGAIMAGFASALFGLACAWHLRGIPDVDDDVAPGPGSGPDPDVPQKTIS